ncbi:oligosaccharide flippase family protein [Sphingomonas panacisoli]|uniref:oligosaccharide flippase family protein n=1 Tax=Sphingomonas panacisoli TaxID=1813879 RepID=UPI00164665D5|nr:oligosaccharide flippase family protein [Sphingomonas panacisoli]
MKKDLLNLASLTCIQGSNALIPLIMFPFLLHTLGASIYADLALAEALSLLVLAVVIFSFEIIGVSELVRFRESGDRVAIDNLFSGVLYIRLLLFLAAAVVAIGFYVLALGKSWSIITLWTFVPLAYVFQSAWVYQGFERNFPLAVFTVLSRIAALSLILLLVHGTDDAILVPGILGTTYLIGGLISFGYAIRHEGLRVHRISGGTLIAMAIDGKEIFFANIAVSVQRDLNVLILGIVGIPAQSLAAYSVAEKLTKSLQAIARPLNQLFFPKAIRAIRTDVTPTWHVARKISRHTLPQVGVVASILLVLTISYLVIRHYALIVIPYNNVDEILRYLSIMAPTVVFGIASYMFGSIGLNYLGGRAYFLAVILVTGTVSGALCFVLAHWIGAYAAAICYASAEVATMLATLMRYGRKSTSLGRAPL